MLKDYGDPELYRCYYKSQAGYALPGFHGTPVMYGSGIGGIFRSLFRKAVPLFRKGMELIKPHVKTAARNIAQDVVGHVTKSVLNKIEPQEGSGYGYLKRRGGVKRKARSMRRGPPKPVKRKRGVSRKQTVRRRKKKKRGVRVQSLKDVF